MRQTKRRIELEKERIHQTNIQRDKERKRRERKKERKDTKTIFQREKD